MTLEEIKTELENFARPHDRAYNLAVVEVQIKALKALAEILMHEADAGRQPLE